MTFNKKWTSIWGNAVSIAEHRPESYSRNITLRYPIDVPFAGNELKFTFDNFCGSEPVCITRATVAVAKPDYNSYKNLSCPIDATQSCTITFGVSATESVIISPHETVVSNPVPLPVAAGSTICVSFFLEDFTLMQSAVLITGPLSKGFFSIGDQTVAEYLPIMETKTTNWFYFLSNIELFTDECNHAIICYGDSITAQDWPDELKLRCRSMGAKHTSVIRRAASGTRVLREYSCIIYDSYGLKGANRFHHELNVPGADSIIIQQGINDIIHPVGSEINIFRPMSDLPTADELIAGLQWYIDEARKAGLSVYIGTLLPIYGWRTYAPFRETLRCQINEWIRSCRSIAGCIDFDVAIRDCSQPEAFAKGYDSGDHLHPSNAAYSKMAEIVPRCLLR